MAEKKFGFYVKATFSNALVGVRASSQEEARKKIENWDWDFLETDAAELVDFEIREPVEIT